jgi:hypothetical protein
LHLPIDITRGDHAGVQYPPVLGKIFEIGHKKPPAIYYKTGLLCHFRENNPFFKSLRMPLFSCRGHGVQNPPVLGKIFEIA